MRPAIRCVDGVDVLAEYGDKHVLIVSVGAFAQLCCEVAERLHDQGIGSLVVDPRWVKPIPIAVIDLARSAKLVVVVEDGMCTGGVGSAVSQVLRDANVEVLVRNIGLPDEFLEHGKRADLLKQFGLTSQEISRTVVETVAVQGTSDVTTRQSSVQQ